MRFLTIPNRLLQLDSHRLACLQIGRARDQQRIRVRVLTTRAASSTCARKRT